MVHLPMVNPAFSSSPKDRALEMGPLRTQYGSRTLWLINGGDTVDGRNPAPVEVGSLSHYLQGFIHLRWCRISCINSTNYLLTYVRPGMILLVVC